MNDYMGKNRSYQNNWSPCIHQKSASVKFKCKDYASKTIDQEKKIKKGIIRNIIYLFLVRRKKIT